RVIGIKFDRVSGKFDLLFQINPTRAVSKSQGTKQCVISLRIFRARKLNVFFLTTSKLSLECSGNLLSDVTLGGEDVDQLSVVCFRPKMRIIQRVDTLHGDSHLSVRYLRTAC